MNPKSSRRAVLATAGAFGLLVVLVVGVRLSRTDYASEAWLTTLLLLIADGVVAWHLLVGGGVKAIRRGALISVLVTMALIANCSTQVGAGANAIQADPIAYLSTLSLLVLPLLLVLAAPGVISLARLTPKTRRWILVASLTGAGAAPLTAYAAFILSYVDFCAKSHPTAAQAAQCVASSSSLASIFGLIGPTMVLPPLLALMNQSRQATAPIPSSPDG